MNVLVDTNLLTGWVNTGASSHQTAVEALRVLRRSGHTPTLVPQNLYEFWVVATRPTDANGFGMRPQEVLDEFDRLRPLFTLMLDERVVFQRWQDLVSRYEVCGKPAHDARLVAAMVRHRISHLLTFDLSGFQRYREIVVVSPESAITDGSAAFQPSK